MSYYKELWSLREKNQILTETNQILKDELINIFDKLADKETRNNIFAIADSLGANCYNIRWRRRSDSDFVWDGRRTEEEEEEAYKRRCLLVPIKYVKSTIKKSYRR